jgi:hypothetical protein
MANGKPKISISNFRGMDDNGALWMDGFDIKKYGGQSVLTAGKNSSFSVSNATSGYTNLTYISSFDKFVSAAELQGEKIIGIGPAGSSVGITTFNPFVTTASGLIYTTQVAPAAYFPGVITMKSGNILFVNGGYAGIGYYGTATGGSATTLVDTTRDFDALGFGTTTGRNKIYNLTKGEARTITVALNDTLTFSSGTTYAASDKYVAFYEDKFTFTSTAHYSGQQAQNEFRRQILSFNDAYYILNGNWLAKLNSDEITFDQYHKQLPSRTQAWCQAFNQDRIVVGCEYQGRGRLLLWDGYASGWVSIIETPKPINAIYQYGSSFVFVMGNSLYVTDGYSYQLLSSIPGAKKSYNVSTIFSGLTVVNDDIYLGGITRDNNRVKGGVYSYNVEDGWAYISNSVSSTVKTYDYLAYSIFYSAETLNQITSTSSIIMSSSLDTSYNINKIDNERADRRSIMLYVKLPQKMNIGVVELNIGSEMSVTNSTSVTKNIYLNYSDCKHDIFSTVDASTGGTTSSFPTNNYTNNKSVGDLMLFLNGSASGERSYITSIDNPLTSSEVINYSPVTSIAPDSGSDVQIIGVKSAGVKSIDDNNIPGEINFTIPSFYSDKLLLEIYIDGNSAIEINSINIY